MRTSVYLIMIVIVVGLFAIANTAFAESIYKIELDNKEFEIRYETINVEIKSITLDRDFASLILEIETDPQKDGFISINFPSAFWDALGGFCKDSPILLIDGDEHEYEMRTHGDAIIFEIDIPRGAKEIEIINTIIIGVGESNLSIEGIPAFDIYTQGQEVSFDGTVIDFCGRKIANQRIHFTMENIPSIFDQTVTDENGRFNINFTIPENLGSGRYEAHFKFPKADRAYGTITRMLIQRTDESNIPFILEHPQLGTFEIPYSLKNGEIINVGVDLVSQIIFLDYFVKQNDTLQVKIPGYLADLIAEANEAFISSCGKNIQYMEHISENLRTFEIPVCKDFGAIMIQGLKYGPDAGTDREGIYPLKINDRYYPLPYNITGAALRNISADVEAKKLIIDVYSPAPNNGGKLRLEMQRDIIDSVQGGVDKEFLVVMSDPFTEPVKAEFVESETNDESRELEITFNKGSNLIAITGTHMVPEFPAVFMLMSILIGVSIFASRLFTKVKK